MYVQAFKLKTLTVISSCVIYELPAAFIEVRFFIFWKEKEVKHKILVVGIMLLCIVGVKETRAQKTCNCGKVNATDCCWDIKDGTLIISGTGATKDYGYGGQPWWSYRNTITSVKVEEGITGLGMRVPFNLTAADVIEVELPKSLISIGKYAFYYSNLSSLVIPDYVTDIGAGALSHCPNLTSLTLPDSLTNVDAAAFADDTTNFGTGYVVNNTVTDLTCSADMLQVYLEHMGGLAIGANINCKAGNCAAVLRAWDAAHETNYANNTNISPFCKNGQVEYKGQCLDEYPFAKKRYTPAEAAQWLNEDNNTVTLTFKK